MTIEQAVATVALEKFVDRTVAAPGDVITYTLHYSVGGGGGLTSLRLVDEIPNFTSYLTGSLQHGGLPPGEGSSGVSGSYLASENRIEVDVGAVTSGESGTVSF